MASKIFKIAGAVEKNCGKAEATEEYKKCKRKSVQIFKHLCSRGKKVNICKMPMLIVKEIVVNNKSSD